MSTWIFDFALINDFPTPNWGHFPLLWVFQVEIWESSVFLGEGIPNYDHLGL